MARAGTVEQRIETRLFVDCDLGAKATVGLDHSRAHYLRSVLRLKPGDLVALFNGRDGEWLARIDGLGKGWASLAVEKELRRQDKDRDLWLVFAPIKRARIDFLAEKATELGVTCLQPVMTERTAVSRVNVERLAANAREAAEQCERLSLPEVREALALPELVQSWPSERHLLVCAEAGEAKPLADALAALPPSSGEEPWAIMTGPEGGFAPSELDALAKLPFVTPVGLGPRILRADTAAIAALACWQVILGDGRQRPTEMHAHYGRAAFGEARED